MRLVFLIFALLSLLIGSSSQHELYGTVEKMPEGKTGEWIVSGRRVLSTPRTELVQRYGRLEKGALVEVEGREQGGVLQAEVIKTRTTKHDEERDFGHKVKFMGVVNAPESEGLWLISGRNVTVKPDTRIEGGPLKAGDTVRVKGYLVDNGVIAVEIEHK